MSVVADCDMCGGDLGEDQVWCEECHDDIVDEFEKDIARLRERVAELERRDKLATSSIARYEEGVARLTRERDEALAELADAEDLMDEILITRDEARARLHVANRLTANANERARLGGDWAEKAERERDEARADLRRLLVLIEDLSDAVVEDQGDGGPDLVRAALRVTDAATRYCVERGIDLAEGGGEHIECQSCSEAGGADRPVYHMPPECSVPSTEGGDDA